jgi:hypothetical protein
MQARALADALDGHGVLFAGHEIENPGAGVGLRRLLAGSSAFCEPDEGSAHRR